MAANLSKIKKVMFGAGLFGFAAGSAWVFGNRRLFTVSDVTTGDSAAYPDLRAHVYFAGAQDATDTAGVAIRELPRWRIVITDGNAHEVHAEVESPIGGFLSDVTVTLVPLGDRHTRAIIHSKSRVGAGDLGENARNIRQLQEAMDRLLIGG
jgi:uncharacterized protein (DUF1499 family)